MSALCFFLLTFISFKIYAATQATDQSKQQTNFDCVMTITKEKDWNKQTVIIDLLDYNTKQVITTFKLDAENPQQNQSAIFSVTKTFNCLQHPATQLQAHYFPIIWSTNKGKKYLSQEVFQLQDQTQQAIKDKAQNIQIDVMFPKDFINVPLQVNL